MGAFLKGLLGLLILIVVCLGIPWVYLAFVTWAPWFADWGGFGRAIYALWVTALALLIIVCLAKMD